MHVCVWGGGGGGGGRPEGLGWWYFVAVVVVVVEVLCMQVDLVCGSQVDLVKRLER